MPAISWTARDTGTYYENSPNIRCLSLMHTDWIFHKFIVDKNANALFVQLRSTRPRSTSCTYDDNFCGGWGSNMPVVSISMPWEGSLCLPSVNLIKCIFHCIQSCEEGSYCNSKIWYWYFFASSISLGTNGGRWICRTFFLYRRSVAATTAHHHMQNLKCNLQITSYIISIQICSDGVPLWCMNHHGAMNREEPTNGSARAMNQH